MRLRLADIAGRAGVSEATVSRVLNDRPGVAEGTRQAVLTALDVLGYERPARLREKAGRLVGLMVPELENPVFPLFAQVIETSLARHGYAPVLCTHSLGGVHEDDYVQTLLEHNVAGIIFVSGMHANTDVSASRYSALRDRGLPIVLVNGFREGVDAPFVSNDDVAAVDLAVGHLAQLGHRRVGLALGQRRYVPVMRKIAGFHEAVRRHLDHDLDHDLGVDEVESLIECTAFGLEGGVAAADALLDRGVTAIVCGSDIMALGSIRAVRQRGLSVPADVSVAGSDDSALIEFTDPPLTTVRQPVPAMGQAAVRALLDEISGSPAPRAEYMFRPELVVRGSTGRAPDGARR